MHASPRLTHASYSPDGRQSTDTSGTVIYFIFFLCMKRIPNRVTLRRAVPSDCQLYCGDSVCVSDAALVFCNCFFFHSSCASGQMKNHTQARKKKRVIRPHWVHPDVFRPIKIKFRNTFRKQDTFKQSAMEVYVDEIKTWIVQVYFIIKFNKEWIFFFFMTMPSNITEYSEILCCLISRANASLSRTCVP